MGLGGLFSDIFGGGNKYRAVQSPILGPPQMRGESSQLYQQRRYADYQKQMEDYQKQISGAQGMGIPQNVLDFSQAQQTLGQNQGLINQLLAQGQGQGPNPALDQLRMTTNQNIASQAAMAAGQRGINPALALRSSSMTGANMNQQAAAQAAAQAAQQQLAAQSQAGQLMGTQAGLQSRMAEAQGQVGLGLLGARTAQEAQARQAQVAYQNMLQNAYNAMNNVNAGVAAQNASTNMQYGMGLMGGIGGALGAAALLANGGEVPYPKGHKKTDVVMHEFGKGSLKSSSGDKVTDPKQAIAIALSEQRRAEGKSRGGVINPDRPMRNPKTRESDRGTQEDMSFVDAIRRKHMASGGLSQYEAFQSGDPLSAELSMSDQMQPGRQMMETGMSKASSALKDYLSNKFAPRGALNTPLSLTGGQGVNSALGLPGGTPSPMFPNLSLTGGQSMPSIPGLSLGMTPQALAVSSGGKIDGRARRAGDSESNDTVPAMLSPGEVVIPRSAMGTHEEAHDFLDQILRKKKVSHYGDVLRAKEAIKMWGGGY